MSGYIIKETGSGEIEIDGEMVPFTDKVGHSFDTSHWRELHFTSMVTGFYDPTIVSIHDDGSIGFSIEGDDVIGDIKLSPEVMDAILAERTRIMGARRN